MEESREELQQKVAQNRELMPQLTKKNDQFIFDLNKALEGSDISEEKKVLAMNDMLTQLVEGQKTGVTAKQLFGTPTEAIDHILNAPEPPREMSFKTIMLDNFLMLFTMLAVITSLFSLFSKNGTASAQGITSLILGGISGAFSFYLIYKYIYVYDEPGADQSKRPGVLKTGGIMAVSFLPWFLVMGVSAFLPVAINPVLNPTITLVMGAATFGLRYWLKKKYNFQGAMFSRRY
ncbi:MAG: DUF1129 family protein [Vagococcus sp.]|uniref:DUF1129 domain-containing protein n=1 Tax=Vagococcus TaxID=2737 RepID=UPI002FC6FF87